MPKAANLKKFSYVIAILFGCLFAARQVYADPILVTEYPNYLIETAIALFLAMIVEISFIVFVYFEKRDIMIALLKGAVIGNLISVPIVNLLFVYGSLSSLPIYLEIILLEIIAVLIDSFLMCLFTRKLISFTKVILVSLFMNLASFLLGIFVAASIFP